MVSAPSIVRLHNQSYTLTAPASAVADWDATVAFTGANSEIGELPGLVSIGVADINSELTYDHAALSTGNPFGSFVIKAGASGSPLTWGTPTVIGDTHVARGACATAPNSDRCRIIAIGYEITNTTADIYKQGSITVAALPSAVTDYGLLTVVDTNAAPYAQHSFQTYFPTKFAATRDGLIGIPGAATWAAKEGAYVIPRMITHTMPVEAPSSNQRAVVCQDSASATAYAATTPLGFQVLDGASYPFIRGVGASGFAATQVFLNGLSHETSLTITMRTIVEYFPTFGSALLSLTTPSPAFSPKAFEIYSRACQLAPYAVPVKQNGAGEYFRKVLHFISAASGAVSPLVGSFAPLAGGISVGTKALANYLGEKANARRIKKGSAPPMPPRVRRDEAGARSMPVRK